MVNNSLACSWAAKKGELSSFYAEKKTSGSFSVSRFFCSSKKMGRWVKPEVYPLFAAVGTVLGICSMQLIRNISTNPEVRVLKENRAAGVLENFEEGKKYKEHGLRKYVRGRRPEVMPNINGFFSDPK